MDPSADTDGERLKVKASLYYSEAKERMTKLGKYKEIKDQIRKPETRNDEPGTWRNAAGDT